MLCPIIIFHIVVVKSEADFGDGFRLRICSVGASVALVTISNQVIQRIQQEVDSQCQSCESVHNKIHPKKLNGCEDTLVAVICDGGDECQTDGCDVDSNLELEKISTRDAIVFKDR